MIDVKPNAIYESSYFRSLELMKLNGDSWLKVKSFSPFESHPYDHVIKRDV